MLGVPSIIALLSKQHLDSESKSLGASLLISIGNAGPVYISFAKEHGIIQALCHWSQSTDNERHHVKIQVPCTGVPPSSPHQCHLISQNCLQLFARRSSFHGANVAVEENSVLSSLHVTPLATFQRAADASRRAGTAVFFPRSQSNIGIQSNSLSCSSHRWVAAALATNTRNARCRAAYAHRRGPRRQAGDAGVCERLHETRARLVLRVIAAECSFAASTHRAAF